jgi:glycosyltransferase 2 family protein
MAHFLPMGSLRRAFSAISVSRFLSMLAIYMFGIAIGSVKWHLVVNSSESDVPISVSVQAYTGGLFGALFLPSVVGGDAVRLAVGIPNSARPAAVVTGNFADRFLDLAALLTLVVVGFILLPGSLPSSLAISPHRFWILYAFLAAVIIAVLLQWVAFRASAGFSERIRGILEQVQQATQALAKQPNRLVVCWLLGIVVQLTYLTVTMLLGAFCGVHLPFRVWLFAWPVSKLAALLPITQGGVGVREAALVAVLEAFGVAAAQGLAAGIASQAVIITGALTAGFCALVLRWSRARSQRQQS